MSKRNQAMDQPGDLAAGSVLEAAAQPGTGSAEAQESAAAVEAQEPSAAAGEVQEAGADAGEVQGAEAVEAQADAVEGLRREVAEWKDRYVRLSAEFDNYRKRTLRERGELVSRAAADTLLRLLPVVDDFDRALQGTAQAEECAAMREGLVLVHRNLLGFLRDAGVVEIEAYGKELDIDYHEAVAISAAPTEALRGRVMDVVRKGYLLNGHVLRHAQVVVGEE